MKNILLFIFGVFLFVGAAGQTTYSDGPQCVQRKAVVGDFPTGVSASLVEQQTFRYATPRKNADNIFQELFVVGLKRKSGFRNGKSMIYVHGGGFRGGSAWSDLTGEVYDCLMLDRGYDIWLVEYRTGWVVCDAVTPANADFCAPSVDSFDFVAAVDNAIVDIKDGLRFIARNGAALGYGTPEILFGTSAGGSSVQQLVLRPEHHQFTIDTLGIKYAYMGFGGDDAANVAGYVWGRIPILYSHNNSDNIAPWSKTNVSNTKHIYTNTKLPQNNGGLDIWNIARASYAGPSSSFYFWVACDQGHGLGQATAFGPNDQYDSLFCGSYGMFDYFIPAADAGTFGVRRITFANGSTPTPVAPPGNPGNLCACETTGNCEPPDNCP